MIVANKLLFYRKDVNARGYTFAKTKKRKGNEK